MFDPYGDWLGISREKRPINCFVLLGIEPDVKDPEAIRAAAADQAGRVKKHEKGPHAQAAARLLKEINLAKTTLLDPARRKAYLARLRNNAAPKKAPTDQAQAAETEPEVEVVAEEEPEVEVVAEEEPEVEVVAEEEPEVEVMTEPEAEVVAEPDEEDSTEEKEEAPAKGKGKAKAKGKKKAGGKPAKKKAAAEGSRKWLWISLGGAAAVLLLGGGLTWYLLWGSKKTDSPARSDSVARNSPSSPGGMTPQGMMPPGMKMPGGSMPPGVTPPSPKNERPTPPKEEPKIQPREEPKTPPPPEEPRTPPPPPPPPPTRPPDPRPAKVVKLPVPDPAAQDMAEKALKSKYKNDYARLGNNYKEEPKRNNPEVILALAAKLLQPGREDRNDPAGWFVLLREARDLAVLAGRPRLAAEAVGELDKWFVVDAPAMKVEALTAILASANSATAESTARVALAHVAPALAADNYDGALKLIAVADAAVLKAKPNEKGKPDEKLQGLVQERRSQVEAWQKAFAAVAEAKKKLASAPEDAAANFAVGRHLCFFQGEWNDGLPLLAKGSDATLKDLAQKDLARPGDAAGQIDVGDGWWKLAELQPERIKANIRERAVYWYEGAEPTAAAEEQARVVQRINEALGAAHKSPRKPYEPGSFFARGTEDRILLLREASGNMRTEEAIEKGLDWLAQHQFSDGHWATDAFPVKKQCNCTECSTEKHDIAATAFGLLPFLGVGETHLKGRHADVVKRGLTWLLRQQKQEGNFSDNMYENALACIALCEAYGLSGDKGLQPRATAAAGYIVAAQNGQGGWGYSPGNPKADSSVTGWQFSALKTAYYAGIKHPQMTATFNHVPDFLDLVADSNGMGYGYDMPGNGLSTTAASLLSREYLGWGPRHPKMRKPLQRLLEPGSFVTKEAPNIYYLFYATQVMHHAGGKFWEGWNPKTRDLLLELQDQGTDGGHDHQKGSFSPRGDTYATQGGRLMFTSLALLTLEVYYYHVPLYGYSPALVQEE
jgi:hypothetical protein